jgi:hypothetical protein
MSQVIELEAEVADLQRQLAAKSEDHKETM